MSETSIQDRTAYGARLSGALWASLRHHRLLLALGLGYSLLAHGLLGLGGYPHELALGVYILGALLPPAAAAVCVLLGHLLQHVFHVRPFRPRGLLATIREDEKFGLERVAMAMVPLLLVPLFSSAFTSVKNAIPLIQPFAYDQAFMELDRALHFGRHPWELLQPVLGHALATSIVSYLYNLWLPLMYLILCWQVFSLRDLRLRQQYLVSFILAWALLGNGLALLLSSAGPCFYGPVVGGPDPYAPLMDYLRTADAGFTNWSLEAQRYLWENYQSTGIAVGGGISAMPSLHVAIATLQALLGWRISRRLGWLLTAYALVILLGSVHLGWHYAVDGYLSIALMLVIWKLAGRWRGPDEPRHALAGAAYSAVRGLR